MQASTGRAPSRSGYRPRQSNYLRISATAVLQMIMYLEPAHVEWMNDSVLERMLIALRDRIPRKLEQEGLGSKTKGREKTQVDVFRGTDYQMAFFFRKSSDKHVVLLKHKHFYAPPRTEAEATGSPDFGGARKRRRRVVVAGTGSRDTPSAAASPAPSAAPEGSWRAASNPPLFRSGEPTFGIEKDDDVIVVKDEPVDDEGLPPPPVPGPSSEREDGAPSPQKKRNLGEVKLEDDDDDEGYDKDVKPTLKVTYQSYKIFGRTLVVIVEPYPPLDPKDLAQPLTGLSTEVRQLSASVAPDSYRRRTAALALRSSISVTPAPALEDRPDGGLFRREETEDAASLRGSVTPSLAPGEEEDEEDGGGAGGEEDAQARLLRAKSTLLANEWPEQGLTGNGDDELPSLDELIERASGKGNVPGAALEVEGDQPDGSI